MAKGGIFKAFLKLTNSNGAQVGTIGEELLESVTSEKTFNVMECGYDSETQQMLWGSQKGKDAPDWFCKAGYKWYNNSFTSERQSAHILNLKIWLPSLKSTMHLSHSHPEQLQWCIVFSAVVLASLGDGSEPTLQWPSTHRNPRGSFSRDLREDDGQENQTKPGHCYWPCPQEAIRLHRCLTKAGSVQTPGQRCFQGYYRDYSAIT